MNALTVLGPVPAERLGITLPHEHLVFDFRDYFFPPTTPAGWQVAQLPVSLEVLGTLRFDPFLLLDNMLHHDLDLTVQELREFSALGGRTVDDPTNVSIGRDPLALKAIAEATGLNLIMGSGHYFEISLGGAFPGLPKVTDEPAVQAAAQALGVTPAQVGLAWLLAHTATTHLIPGTADLAHLEANLAVGGITLDDATLAALDAVPSRSGDIAAP